MIRLMGNHLIIPGGTRTIDATGKFIIPGGIDMNVHLQRPGIKLHDHLIIHTRLLHCSYYQDLELRQLMISTREQRLLLQEVG